MDEHLEASYEERYDPEREEKADDPYEDESYETCSLCTTLVPWSELTSSDAGNICPDCGDDYDWSFDSHGDPNF